MHGYAISQVAERTGFSASTLRFYEQSGLVRPERTAAGYRCYDDRDVERLAFIGRAKGLGLSLDEITELLVLLDDERCGPVQGRLRELVAARIADAQQRTAELIAFTGELQRVTATLSGHTPDGPCDDDCGCTVDGAPSSDPSHEPVSTVLAMEGEAGASAPVACTLAPDRVERRLADWQATIARGTSRERVHGGVRVRFPRGTDVAALAGLAAAEQECCRFFTFGIVLDGDGVVFDVTGPPGAQPVIDALVGVGG